MTQTKNPAAIDLLLLDVDGVLTDGSIIYGNRQVELKQFNVKDGFGIRRLIRAGIQTGIITGRRSEALLTRCLDLGIDLVFDGIKDKLSVLDIIETQTGIDRRNMAFMGDDLPDIPIMVASGYSFAPGDAVEAVRHQADLVTKKGGGHGAVREVCDYILRAKGLSE